MMTEMRISLREQTRQRIARALEEDERKRRERILGMLEEGPMSSKDMADRLGVPQPLIVSELNELRSQGRVGNRETDRLGEALRRLLERSK